MGLVYDVITPAEADRYLRGYTDWANVDYLDKVDHIAAASIFVQTEWACADIDWQDQTSIPEEVDRAVALYSYANFKGTLYGDLGTPDEPKGNLRSVKDGVGPLQTEKSWYRGGSYSPSGKDKSLALPDSLMKVYCTTVSSTGELTRV